jgi:anti-sigma factor RsiW
MAGFSDEMLMRFADGELDEETSARVEAAVATDDAVAARLAVFVQTRLAAGDALRPLLDEPVPAALRQSVQSMIDRHRRDAIETSSPRRRGVMRLFPPAFSWPQLAAAASIAAVLGGLGGFKLAEQFRAAPLQLAGLDASSLSRALETVPAGHETQLGGSSQRFKAIATFRDSANAVCREFEVDIADHSTIVSVACNNAGEWRTRFAVVAPGSERGYAPASSTAALEAYLNAIDAGQSLNPAEETQALAELREKKAE